MVDDPGQLLADVHDLSDDRADRLGMIIVIIFNILRMMMIIKGI